jgi:DNA excision repair protein ERCC-4
MKIAAPKAPRPRSPPDEGGPVIVIDTREQDPLPIAGLPFLRGTLVSGDYSILGAEELFAVERKSIADLVACCTGENRSRFERELHRLRGFEFARLLVVGAPEDIAAGRYRSCIPPASVLGSLAAWEVRYRVPVVFAPTVLGAVSYVESWALWFARERIKTAHAISRQGDKL